MYHNQEGISMTTYKRTALWVEVHIQDNDWTCFPKTLWDEYKTQHDLTDQQLAEQMQAYELDIRNES
jgi:hypothetical protein